LLLNLRSRSNSVRSCWRLSIIGITRFWNELSRLIYFLFHSWLNVLRWRHSVIIFKFIHIEVIFKHILSFLLLLCYLRPLLFLDFPKFLLFLSFLILPLNLVLFPVCLALAPVDMTILIFIAHITTAWLAFLSLTAAVVHVTFQFLKLQGLLTIPAGLRPLITFVFVCLVGLSREFNHTVLAFDFGMSFLFMLLSFSFKDYFSTDLALVIISCTTDFMHSEFANFYLSFTSWTLFGRFRLLLAWHVNDFLLKKWLISWSFEKPTFFFTV
jgi:hypothetical protein